MVRTSRKTLRKKKTYAKRTKRALNRRYRKRKIIPKNNFPLGLSFMTRLKYVETITLDPAALSNQTYVFSANGVYDPNITGAGHQPYGFDQLITMYNHYHVVGSRINVKMATNGGLSFYTGILLRDTATANSVLYGTNYLLEQPNSSFKLCPYGNSGGGIVSLRKSFSTKKFFKTKAVLENSLFRGDSTTNPAEGAFYHVIITPFNDAADNVPAQSMTVTIEYIVVFTEPRMLVPS